MIQTVKSFRVVSEAVYAFLEFLCFLYDPTSAGNLISGSSASSKPSVYICKFLVHVLLKPRLKEFEHNLASMWNECNFTVVWTFFCIVLLWDWNEKWPFPVLWPLLSFTNLLAYLTLIDLNLDYLTFRCIWLDSGIERRFSVGPFCHCVGCHVRVTVPFNWL